MAIRVAGWRRRAKKQQVDGPATKPTTIIMVPMPTLPREHTSPDDDNSTNAARQPKTRLKTTLKTISQLVVVIGFATGALLGFLGIQYFTDPVPQTRGGEIDLLMSTSQQVSANSLNQYPGPNALVEEIMTSHSMRIQIGFDSQFGARWYLAFMGHAASDLVSADLPKGLRISDCSHILRKDHPCKTITGEIPPPEPNVVKPNADPLILPICATPGIAGYEDPAVMAMRSAVRFTIHTRNEQFGYTLYDKGYAFPEELSGVYRGSAAIRNRKAWIQISPSVTLCRQLVLPSGYLAKQVIPDATSRLANTVTWFESSDTAAESDTPGVIIQRSNAGLISNAFIIAAGVAFSLSGGFVPTLLFSMLEDHRAKDKPDVTPED